MLVGYLHAEGLSNCRPCDVFVPVPFAPRVALFLMSGRSLSNRPADCQRAPFVESVFGYIGYPGSDTLCKWTKQIARGHISVVMNEQTWLLENVNA